jgi:hypothetical protein
MDWRLDLLTQTGTTSNSTLYKSLRHTMSSQSSLVVPWQWICKFHCNYSTYKVFFSQTYSCNYFLHNWTANPKLIPSVLQSSQLKSKSKSYSDWQSVSQSVTVSYPIWGIWPEICLLGLILRKLQSCLCGRPLWREIGSVVCRSVFCVMSLSELYIIYLQNI